MTTYNTDKLNAVSTLAGFGAQDTKIGSQLMPASQTIAAFNYGTIFTFTVPKPDNKSIFFVLFRLAGPTNSDNTTHDPNKWKIGGGSTTVWTNLDGVSINLYTSILFSENNVTMTAKYFNNTAAPVTYNPATTVYAKVFFFKYPWA